MRNLPLVLFMVLFAAAACLISSLAEQLPELVAVHFDAGGVANGFTTREDCRMFMLTLTLGAPVFILVVGALIPRLLPPSMINIPNRAHWLAPERAADSIAFLSEQGVWFACIFIVFLAGVDWMLARANATVPPAFPTRLFCWTLVLFFCAMGCWAIRMFRRFRAPP